MSLRLEFQRVHARGRIVNIGCAEDPAKFRTRAVHVDLNLWRLPNFVQADAHYLPFANDAFDTAVLGDILEHSPDPLKMLREAGRVAYRVVITVPEETRLPSPGQHIAEGIARGESEMREQGFTSIEELHRAHWGPSFVKGFPDAVIPMKASFIEGFPDALIPHSFHINWFTDESLKNIIEQAGLCIVRGGKMPEGIFQFWNYVLERV